jgi:hypothetical protein
MEKLKLIVTKKISKIAKINSKLTMIIDEKPSSALQEQVFSKSNPLIT